MRTQRQCRHATNEPSHATIGMADATLEPEIATGAPSHATDPSATATCDSADATGGWADATSAPSAGGAPRRGRGEKLRRRTRSSRRGRQTRRREPHRRHWGLGSGQWGKAKTRGRGSQSARDIATTPHPLRASPSGTSPRRGGEKEGRHGLRIGCLTPRSLLRETPLTPRPPRSLLRETPPPTTPRPPRCLQGARARRHSGLGTGEWGQTRKHSRMGRHHISRISHIQPNHGILGDLPTHRP